MIVEQLNTESATVVVRDKIHPPPAALAVEFAVLFVVIPGLMALRLVPAMPIPVLLFCGAAILGLLRLDRTFDWRRLLRWSVPRRETRRLLLTCVAATVFLASVAALVKPALLFSFPRRAPGFWLLVMILYPLLSVAPQEFLFRVFLSHRYRPLFRNPWVLVAASGLTFGFAHLLFGSWLSVLLSAMGGLMFAFTYLRTGSFLAVCLEHAILGDVIFTVGLGQYFYHAAAR